MAQIRLVVVHPHRVTHPPALAAAGHRLGHASSPARLRRNVSSGTLSAKASAGEGSSRFLQMPPSEQFRDLDRSEEHTSELQSLMRNSYAVFCLKKKNTIS